jgi:hypothetical protein
MKLQARKVIKIEPVNVLNNLTGEFTLIFDDGEVKTNAKQTFISSFCWDIHRHFPKLPLLKKHHLTSIIGIDGVYKASSHVSVLDEIIKTWYESHPDYTHKEQHTLFKLMYLITNNLYNVCSVNFLNHISSMDIVEFIDILQNDRIKEIKAKGDYSQKGIKKVQKEIANEIKNSPDFKHNYVSINSKSGLVKEQQLVQCIGPWGFPMDVDSFPFTTPIISGYIEGLSKLYDSLTESRTASMALQYQDNPLKDTETYSRKNQLLGLQIERLHRTDCGSTQYHYRVINDDIELVNMDGIYRWDKDENKLIPIDPNQDKHLIGKLVAIRSPFHCKHPDPNGICEVCFGRLSKNVVAGTNIGQQTVVSMNSVISQLVLSTKHHIGSGQVANIVLRGDMDRYFRVTKNGLGYLLNPDIIVNTLRSLNYKSAINKNDYFIIFSFKSDSLKNISDAINIDNLNNLSPDRVTSISSVKYELYSKSQPDKYIASTNLEIAFQGRKAYMSREFLKYMKNSKNWKVSFRGNYDVNISDFPIDEPLFFIPPKQFNTIAYSDIIQNLLGGAVNDKKERDENTNIASFFELFASTVYEKMVFHFSVLQTIFYSILVTSSKDNEGALPKPWTDSGIGVYETTMLIRSLSPALLYKGVNRYFTSPVSFLQTNRPDHPMDYLILPQYVTKTNHIEPLDETDI